MVRRSEWRLVPEGGTFVRAFGTRLRIRRRGIDGLGDGSRNLVLVVRRRLVPVMEYVSRCTVGWVLTGLPLGTAASSYA